MTKEYNFLGIELDSAVRTEEQKGEDMKSSSIAMKA